MKVKYTNIATKIMLHITMPIIVSAITLITIFKNFCKEKK